MGPLCIQIPPSGWNLTSGVNYIIERITWNKRCRFGICVWVPVFETRTLHTYNRTSLANQCKAGQTNRFGMCVNNGLHVYVRSHIDSSAVPDIVTSSLVRPVAIKANRIG